MIHQFPIYWWSLPGIHKGWMDRILAYYFCYGGEVAALKDKLWMCSTTIGGPTSMYITGGYLGVLYLLNSL